jgi:hypothetical protein
VPGQAAQRDGDGALIAKGVVGRVVFTDALPARILIL